jgi:hypothetical protein
MTTVFAKKNKRENDFIDCFDEYVDECYDDECLMFSMMIMRDR